ncbi:IFRD domain-containing protein [Aspergillus mulundensis]|uniref:Interferon-related developmental regulator N-terminal domain-containing protein n=1 Tax=Aspergillus mulundensis TaxID=1810919 RepID=A0A3D8SLL9_9EURO|nr:hypothetical protein DSM5745_03804 [Aspergillus mulundensis]RDW87162.1 hypothetical protein DSM5745_03804 [Aspergillus mulundensis]
MSRKAASREGSRRTSPSRTNSAHTSRQSSRNASRQTSDDEDAGNLSDDTAVSLASFDDLESIDTENDNNNWEQELLEVIDDVLDRKRSSALSREENYAAYCRLSKFHYVEDLIRSRVPDLLAAFTRSIRTETSVRETTLAMRALELLAITAADNTIFEHAEPLLTRTIRNSSDVIKAAAIHCLGTCTMFGGAGVEGIEDQMTFLLDIAASDGQSIDAQDGAAVCVTAALQEWGFMATEINDLSSESEEFIQIFVDQLNSGDPSVQIAAGENIALLYERSYSPQESWSDEGEEDDSNEEESPDTRPKEEVLRDGPKRVKRYNPYHDTPELERQLQSLATFHSKRINKRDKRDLRKSFASIRETVADPRHGPFYDEYRGSKLTVKIGQQGVMHIDRWEKWVRLNSLRRILQGGFPVHYFEGNTAVLDSLPVVMMRRPDSF